MNLSKLKFKKLISYFQDSKTNITEEKDKFPAKEINYYLRKIFT